MANSTPSRLGKILQGLLFVLIGIGLLVIAGNLTLERREFIASAQTADGIVSDLNAGGSHPEIAFTTGSGEKISYPQGGFIFGYQKDQPVRCTTSLSGRPTAQSSTILQHSGPPRVCSA